MNKAIRTIKGKNAVEPTAPKQYPITPIIKYSHEKHNVKAHTFYLNQTIDTAATLRDIVEDSYALHPNDTEWDYMHVYTERIQEFLKYVEYASPILPNPSPIASPNRNRNVRFSDPLIIPGHTNAFNTNVPKLSSLGVIPSTQTRGSQT